LCGRNDFNFESPRRTAFGEGLGETFLLNIEEKLGAAKLPPVI